MKTVKTTSATIQFIEKEGATGNTEDVYLIKISGTSAKSYINDQETGSFNLSPDEIARIFSAETASEAFAVLEE